MSEDRNTCLLPYFGGKWKMRSKILPFMPPHQHYVEPFGGSAAILLSKSPCNGVETYNDVWSAITDFFRVLKDPQLFKQFYRRVQAVGVSRELYNEYRKTWQEPEDIVERVARWFIVARQSFSGIFNGHLSTTVTYSPCNIAGACSKWRTAIDKLPHFHNRLLTIQVENDDWKNVLRRYQGNGYLAYCDPPYIKETRRGGGYKYEMDAEGHGELVETLLKYEGAVVLSGYWHEVYRPLIDNEWECHTMNVECQAAGKIRGSDLKGDGACEENQRRTECIWRNPEAVRRCRQRDEPLFSGA